MSEDGGVQPTINLPLWIRVILLVLTIEALVAAVAILPMLGNARDDRAQQRDRAAVAARHAQVGADALAAGDLTMAGLAYAEALAVTPYVPEWEEALADVHVRQILERNSAITEANATRLQLELSGRLIDGGRDAATLTAYSKVLLFRGETASARARLREAIELDGELAAAHVFLADALLRDKEWTGAMAAAERALGVTPDDPLAHYAMARAQAGQEKWEAAARHYAKAAAGLEDASIYRLLAKAYAEQEKWAEAESAYREALQRRPDWVAIYSDYGRALALNGKLVPAARFFGTAYERTGDLEAYASLGDVALRAQDFARAVQVFTEVIRAKGPDPEMVCRLGYAHDGAGDRARAKAAFERCQRSATGIEGKEKLARAAASKLQAYAQEGESSSEADTAGAPKARRPR